MDNVSIFVPRPKPPQLLITLQRCIGFVMTAFFCTVMTASVPAFLYHCMTKRPQMLLASFEKKERGLGFPRPSKAA